MAKEILSNLEYERFSSPKELCEFVNKYEKKANTDIKIVSIIQDVVGNQTLYYYETFENITDEPPRTQS